MRNTPLFVAVVLGLLAGCQPTYPGGLNEREWNALPPERKAQLQLQQDSVDEQRRANSNQEALQDRVLEDQRREQERARAQYAAPAVRDSADGVRTWAVMGRRDVDFRMDHDVIPIGPAAGGYSVLRFTVRGGDLDVYKLIVVLDNGQRLGFDVRGHYEENTMSPAMAVPGRRPVDHLEITYRSHAGHGGRTIFTLHGK